MNVGERAHGLSLRYTCTYTETMLRTRHLNTYKYFKQICKLSLGCNLSLLNIMADISSLSTVWIVSSWNLIFLKQNM